ncbi:MAG: hypothetical protein JXA10_09620, partial [Anaerolineae bacterium]|nr:hypothetical protein [Anaerolineae bacterium]
RDVIAEAQAYQTQRAVLQAQVSDAAAATVAAYTVVPSQTPLPTYTLQPTYTTVPSSTPTPEPTRDVIAEAQAYQTQRAVMQAQVSEAAAATVAAYTAVPSQTPLPTYTLQPTYTLYPTMTAGPDVIATYAAQATMTTEAQAVQMATDVAAAVVGTLTAWPTNTPTATWTPSPTYTATKTLTPMPPTVVTLAPSSTAPTPDLFGSATAQVMPTLRPAEMTATHIISMATATAAAQQTQPAVITPTVTSTPPAAPVIDYNATSTAVIQTATAAAQPPEPLPVTFDVPKGWTMPEQIDSNTWYMTDGTAEVFVYLGDAAYFEQEWDIPATETDLDPASVALAESVGGQLADLDFDRNVARIQVLNDDDTEGAVYLKRVEEDWVIVSAVAPANSAAAYRINEFERIVLSIAPPPDPSLITPTVTPTPFAVPLVSYNNEQLGLAFDVPAGWFEAPLEDSSSTDESVAIKSLAFLTEPDDLESGIISSPAIIMLRVTVLDSALLDQVGSPTGTMENFSGLSADNFYPYDQANYPATRGFSTGEDDNIPVAVYGVEFETGDWAVILLGIPDGKNLALYDEIVMKPLIRSLRVTGPILLETTPPADQPTPTLTPSPTVAVDSQAAQPIPVAFEIPKGWTAPAQMDSHTWYLTDNTAEIFIYAGDADYFEQEWDIPATETDFDPASVALAESLGGQLADLDFDRQIARIQVGGDNVEGAVYLKRLGAEWVIVSATAPVNSIAAYRINDFELIVNTLQLASESDIDMPVFVPSPTISPGEITATARVFQNATIMAHYEGTATAMAATRIAGSTPIYTPTYTPTPLPPTLSAADTSPTPVPPPLSAGQMTATKIIGDATATAAEMATVAPPTLSAGQMTATKLVGDATATMSAVQTVTAMPQPTLPPSPSATASLDFPATATAIVAEATATAEALAAEPFPVMFVAPDGWEQSRLDANRIYLTDGTAEIFIYAGDADYFEQTWHIPAGETDFGAAFKALKAARGGIVRRLNPGQGIGVMALPTVADSPEQGQIYLVSLVGNWVVVSVNAPVEEFNAYRVDVFDPLVESLEAAE